MVNGKMQGVHLTSWNLHPLQVASALQVADWIDSCCLQHISMLASTVAVVQDSMQYKGNRNFRSHVLSLPWAKMRWNFRSSLRVNIIGLHT